MYNTVSCLLPFIIHQNVFCLHRSYLLPSDRMRAVCKCVSYCVMFCILVLNTVEILRGDYDDSFLRTFETFLMTEHALLIIGASTGSSAFDAVKKMDELCGMNEMQCLDLRKQVMMTTAVSTILVTVDAINFIILPATSPAISLGIWAAFGAHNSDLMLYGLLIKSVNLRLAALKNKIGKHGALEYRNILVATSHLSSQFNLRMFLILSVTFISTLIYLVVLLLSDTAVFQELALVIVCRELNSLGSLWFVCQAADTSELHCDKLTSYFVGKVVLPRSHHDGIRDIKKCDEQKQTMYRWLCCVAQERPQYCAGQTVVLSLATPLDLLNISATYLLILLQIYIDSTYRGASSVVTAQPSLLATPSSQATVV